MTSQHTQENNWESVDELVASVHKKTIKLGSGDVYHTGTLKSAIMSLIATSNDALVEEMLGEMDNVKPAPESDYKFRGSTKFGLDIARNIIRNHLSTTNKDREV